MTYNVLSVALNNQPTNTAMLCLTLMCSLVSWYVELTRITRVRRRQTLLLDSSQVGILNARVGIHGLPFSSEARN